ncbi:MAG: (2Fe-2S)-binding protein [Pigmentiphaga sp.]
MTTLMVNGELRDLDSPSDTPLLWVLRDEFGLTGTKFGCGLGLCGACTVLQEGRAVRSCLVPVGQLDGAHILTIEGLSGDRSHPVQKAWLAEQVPQCGYCQSGMILATVALLERNPDPTDAEIEQALDNLCRCGTYLRIKRAIHRVADAAPRT